MLAPGRFVNNLLVDGVLRATWWIERDGDRATLAIRPAGKLTAAERRAVDDEAARMIAFAAPDTRGPGRAVRGPRLVLVDVDLAQPVRVHVVDEAAHPVAVRDE